MSPVNKARIAFAMCRRIGNETSSSWQTMCLEENQAQGQSERSGGITVSGDLLPNGYDVNIRWTCGIGAQVLTCNCRLKSTLQSPHVHRMDNATTSEFETA